MYAADYDTGEIFIYDIIGDPWFGMIGAENVIGDLAKMQGKRVTVRLSSPGGSVSEGVAIYNALQRHRGGVDTVVDASAYSIAHYIMQAGERRVVAKNSTTMLHKPWTIAGGNAGELRAVADRLDKFEDSVLETYVDRTGKTADEMRAIFAGIGAEDGTWYTAAEAVAAGFADEVGDIAPETAPAFASAMFGKEPKGQRQQEPQAGTRTPWAIQPRAIRRETMRAIFGR